MVYLINNVEVTPTSNNLSTSNGVSKETSTPDQTDSKEEPNNKKDVKRSPSSRGTLELQRSKLSEPEV